MFILRHSTECQSLSALPVRSVVAFVLRCRGNQVLWLVLACLCSFIGAVGSAQAGCHALGEDWYRDYHHGHQAGGVVRRLVDNTEATEHQIFVYEDGELTAVQNPLPYRCQGPQCQDSPYESLGNIAVVEHKRTVTYAARVIERHVSLFPVVCEELAFSVSAETLAGFPASLEEPPR